MCQCISWYILFCSQYEVLGDEFYPITKVLIGFSHLTRNMSPGSLIFEFLRHHYEDEACGKFRAWSSALSEEVKDGSYAQRISLT